MTYAAVAEKILASRPDPDRRRELVTLSDRLLEDLEQLNLAAYPGVPPHRPVDGHPRRVVRLPIELARAVNGLLVEIDLPVRHLWNTAGALDAVFAAQAALFGTLEDEIDVNSTVIE